MRKLVVSNFVSLDGFVEGPERDVMALPFDDSFDEYNLQRIRAADTLLAGRVTYQQLMAYWLPLADDRSASSLQREIGRFLRDAPKVVVSDTLPRQEIHGHRTTIVRRGEAAEAVVDLKRRPGRDILVFGSHTTWNPLLAAGLVDEVHIMVGCAATGSGTPIFTGPTPRMRLLDTWRSPGADSIVLRYAAGARRRGRRICN